LYAAKERISIFPIAVKWNRDYSMDLKKVKPLKLPWHIVEKEAHDRGCYLFLLKLRKKAMIRVGEMGDVSFRKGYYIYVGSARKNLSKRLERHKRMRKKAFWHIDYLRAKADVHALLPILTEDDLECRVARAIRDIADWEIPSFGSSDCSCPSHLFGTDNDPLSSPRFHKILQYYRMERLIKKYKI
jgi:sugar fermentation stimulation protein A